MAVETLNFAAQVNEWVRESKARMLAVFQSSVQDVVAHMQTPLAAGGNMPVDTGFLRASLQLSLDGPRPLSQANPGGPKYEYQATAAALVILGAKIGDTVYASYTANYASFVEYGGKGRQGRHFVALAAQRWPSIVEQNVQKLQQLQNAKS